MTKNLRIFDFYHDEKPHFGPEVWFSENGAPKLKLTPNTEFFISRAKNWWKQMVNPKEQVAEVSARETKVDLLEINFCSASFRKMTLYV